MNLAVPARTFDAKFEAVFTKVVYVNRAYGHGIFDLRDVRYTEGLSAEGLFDWTAAPFRSFRFTPERGYIEEPYVPGWRINQHAAPKETPSK